MQTRIGLIITLMVAWIAAAGAQTVHLESPGPRVSLLELYTSEGCSSCPPADRWISTLRDDPRLWHEVVPVAFHVDYWDYIGWKDRFASPVYGNRQRDYARNRHVGTVYTPGFVLAGKEWRSWFRRPELKVDNTVTAGVNNFEIDEYAANDDGRFWKSDILIFSAGPDGLIKTFVPGDDHPTDDITNFLPE